MKSLPRVTEALRTFAAAHGFDNKGRLCVALIVTQHVRKLGLPLDPESLLTSGGGQVQGLGRGTVQKVLQRYGIHRVLAAEGGRTSRGSIQSMRAYVSFLNAQAEREDLDLESVESFWISRVQQFFAGKPFALKLDPSHGLRAAMGDVLRQAAIRQQKVASGMKYAGAVMQHLVGAKLEVALGKGSIQHSPFTLEVEHHSFSTADAQRGRHGDFVVGGVAIHVTTAPSEAVIERCRENLSEGLAAMIVTTKTQVAVAEAMAEARSLADRLDILEIEQFLVLNLYEWGAFDSQSRKAAVGQLVDAYNSIIESVETDPSLRIEYRS